MTTEGPALLEVGTVARAHGLRGEVIVALVTDRVERLDPGSVLASDRGDLTVLSATPHQGRWIVAFAGVSSRDAADARSPRDGRFIEIVGTYEPRAEPSRVTIDNGKAVAWLRKGAQPTERVEKLLRISGAWDEFKGTSS